MSKHLRSRRGLGLAEVIVAMAIIVVVSVTAMNLVMRFSAISGNMTQRNNGINVVEKGMECFKFADNQSHFEALLYNLVDTELKVEEGTIYVFEGAGYTVRMKVYYGTTSATFLATVRDSKDRMVLSIPRYERYY